MLYYRERRATKNMKNIHPPKGKYKNELSTLLLFLEVVELLLRRNA